MKRKLKEESRKIMALKVAEFYVIKKSTVRETAVEFGMSKSWVYRMLTVHLPQYDKNLYEKVVEIIMENKMLRSSRGGKTTQKILKDRKNKICL